ncbi:hypothetical protein KL949_004849 [Ogataea haglerorum]|nr:hypothetical protein KL951_002934 [Ogataea haglerorum]KAG7707077.1 hypothetical protein KL914_002961 [Ogataea haglerorum]KAG7713786.1 hypothetical protein KL913_004810 [Ogataea haglerorum]KAG7714219.1 hypothetical protein KL949_004849 [Ogataea haglerorum]KAG7731940.1 hypothetical protein KL948_002873 [Ogataea haglerorum]
MIEQLEHESLAELVADILERDVAQLKTYSRVRYVCVQLFRLHTVAALLARLQFEPCTSVVLHGLWEQLSVVYSEILTTPEPSYVSEFSEYKVSIVVLVLYKLQVLSERKRVFLSDGAAVVQRLGAIFVSKNDTLDDVKRFREHNLVSVEQLASQFGMKFSRKATAGSGTGSAAG